MTSGRGQTDTGVPPQWGAGDFDGVATRFDHFDPAFQDDPYPYYRQLRTGCPVGRSDLYGGFWFFSTYEDVSFAYHHPELFSSHPNAIPAAIGAAGAMIPLEVDPPEHGEYRRMLDPLFAPKAVAWLEDEVRGHVREILDAIFAAGRCEFVEDLAVPVPCRVFLQLMGMPLDMMDTFNEWKDRVIHAKGAPPGDGEAQVAVRMGAGLEVTQFYAEMMEKRRVQPSDDIVSYLVNDARKRDGDGLTDFEVLNICFLFFIAGLDTVTAALGNAFAYLADHPDARDQIVADPALISGAVDEFLRFDSPIQPGRTVTQDFEYKGTAFRKGDRVMLLDGSASRDETVFERPDEVDFRRHPNRHIGFGVGPHRCLGSHLARLEMRVVFEEWHKRIPNYEITAGDGVRRHTAMVRGVDHLPLSWNVG